MSPRVRRRGAVRSTSPALKISPCRRTLVPGLRPAGSKVMKASSTRTFSMGMTASRPAGTGAPVMMRSAEPSGRGSSKGWPAVAMPQTGSLTESVSGRSAVRSAKPSMAELSKWGKLNCAATLSERMRPCASSRGTASQAPSRGATASRSARVTSSKSARMAFDMSKSFNVSAADAAILGF